MKSAAPFSPPQPLEGALLEGHGRHPRGHDGVARGVRRVGLPSNAHVAPRTRVGASAASTNASAATRTVPRPPRHIGATELLNAALDPGAVEHALDHGASGGRDTCVRARGGGAVAIARRGDFFRRQPQAGCGCGSAMPFSAVRATALSAIDLARRHALPLALPLATIGIDIARPRQHCHW